MKRNIVKALLIVTLLIALCVSAAAVGITAEYDANGAITVSELPQETAAMFSAIYDGTTGQMKDIYSLNPGVSMQARTPTDGELMKLFLLDSSNTPVYGEITVQEKGRVCLSYDDRIELKTIPASDPVIVTKSITSKNSVTGEADTAVMTYDSATNTLIASGVGIAEVTVDGEKTIYEVKAAPISLLIITGHSVGEGAAGDPAQSIANIPGQVYSTYAPAEEDLLTTADGLSLGLCSASRPAGIDALVTNGGGTKGEGSALAYRWHALTGEKIWVVNTAHGGTNLLSWQPDTADYEHTVEQVGFVQSILAREIAAGHYTFSHMGVINHSSANSDEIWPTDRYTQHFEAMCAGFRSELAFDLTGDGEKEQIEFFALSPLWYMSDMYMQIANPFPLSKRLRFNPGRLTNYTNGVLADHPDVFIGCSLGRSFLTNGDLAAYFAKTGPAFDTDYPTQNGAALSEPTVMAGEMFPDGVHYSQVGYNAAGMNIAENILSYLNDEAVRSVTLMEDDGLNEIGDTYDMAVGDSIRVAALPDPICINDLTFETSGSVSLSQMNKITAVSEGEGTFTVKEGQNVLRTVTFNVVSLPDYTETVSTSTDYANYGGDSWEVTPKLVEATIGTREKYTLALAASYWANADYTGYNKEPTMLGVNFTSGDGLLKFCVRVDEGPIWGGAECELLTVIPTLAAYELTETTTVTGTIDIYWRGFCSMPFSITIKPEGAENLPPYTITKDNRTDYASYGEGWEIEPKLLEAEVGVREKYTMALASSFWAPTEYSGYSKTPTLLSATFTNGEGLLNFEVNIDNYSIWGGEYECELLTITPTSAAYYLTEPVTVTGTLSIYWRGQCQMPFSITLKPAEKPSDLPDYKITVSDRTDYASLAAAWETTPSLLTAELSAREKYSMALCTDYWANVSYSGYSAIPTELDATFTSGDGLLSFSVAITSGPVWGGAVCEYLTITPTDAAFTITEPVTVTGEIDIYWTHYTKIPFKITLNPYEKEKQIVINESTACCNDDWNWTGEGDSIASLPAGTITTDQIYAAALASNYWCDNTYSRTAAPAEISFTSGEGLLTCALQVRNEPVIWSGNECVFALFTPTAAGEAVTAATTVTGTIPMFYASWGTYANIPFSVTLTPKA